MVSNAGVVNGVMQPNQQPPMRLRAYNLYAVCGFFRKTGQASYR